MMNITSTVSYSSKGHPDMLAAKKPWAKYVSTNFNSVQNKIFDSSGNNRAAAITFDLLYFIDPSFRQPKLQGSQYSTMLFPDGSLPINYTLASVTRYRPGGQKRRIIASPTVNFTHSHFNLYNGLFHNTSAMSLFNTNYGSQDSWCVAVSTNATNVAPPFNCSINGQNVGTAKAPVGTTAAQLCINLSHHDVMGTYSSTVVSDVSDFQFYSLIIYDQLFTVAEMAYLSSSLVSLIT